MLSDDQLMQLVAALESRTTTWREIKTYFKINYKTLIHILRNSNIPYIPQKPGRRPLVVNPDTRRQVIPIREKFLIGYHRITETLLKEGIATSEREIKQIFLEEDFYDQEKPYHDKGSHPNRFYATHVNYLWHTDLHFWRKIIVEGEQIQSLLIAFIDDLSRKILHIEVLLNKAMVTTGAALRRALSYNPKPKMMMTDNGKEFIGADFTAVLDEFQIEITLTDPYTPQQNGKIERWWYTLERGIINPDDLQEFVDLYNTRWSHSWLTA
jgi:putative transposase